MARAASAADRVVVTLEIVGVTQPHGAFRAALIAQGDGFPDGAPTATASAPARGEPVTLAFPPVAPGAYAVSLYQDVNGNGTFDQNLLGLPQEPFGFSRIESIGLSAPNFEDARFNLAEDRTVRIALIFADEADD